MSLPSSSSRISAIGFNAEQIGKFVRSDAQWNCRGNGGVPSLAEMLRWFCGSLLATESPADYFGASFHFAAEVGKLKAQVWDLGGQESIRYVVLA